MGVEPSAEIRDLVEMKLISSNEDEAIVKAGVDFWLLLRIKNPFLVRFKGVETLPEHLTSAYRDELGADLSQHLILLYRHLLTISEGELYLDMSSNPDKTTFCKARAELETMDKLSVFMKMVILSVLGIHLFDSSVLFTTSSSSQNRGLIIVLLLSSMVSGSET
jgi:hypothetical protein